MQTPSKGVNASLELSYSPNSMIEEEKSEVVMIDTSSALVQAKVG